AFESWAEGVNGDGSVVVGYSSSASGREAFHWTSDGGMMGLGKLPGGINSVAHGVSGDGSVVVGWNDLDPGFGAFYWTADGGMQSLWDVLISHGVDPAADGWTELGSARGISADGNTIVGWGVRNGNFEAFVAVIPTIVPEPATGALALLGVSSILLLRRRSLGRPIKLKVLPFQALAGALTLIAAAPAAAIDTEPLNNSQLRADSLALSAPGTAVSNFAQLGGAGGDVDFFQTPLAAGEVLFGMVTPLAGLPSGVGLPETMVSVFDNSGRRTFNDLEDIGGGEGSIFRFLSPAAADYRIGVSGCCDFAFDGAASGFSHVESGGYILTAGRVNPVVPGGGFADTDPANQSAAGADLIALFPGAARVAVAQLIDSDVDFFRLDLKAGDVLSAMTAPLANLGVSFDRPDTLLGLFDSSGTNLLVENDDAGGETSIAIMNSETGEFDSTSGSTDFPFDGASWGSALRAYIPADGTYYLAVTGTFDDGDVGRHAVTGAIRADPTEASRVVAHQHRHLAGVVEFTGGIAVPGADEQVHGAVLAQVTDGYREGLDREGIHVAVDRRGEGAIAVAQQDAHLPGSLAAGDQVELAVVIEITHRHAVRAGAGWEFDSAVETPLSIAE
ncbi:MAG TPA: hypothetical protein VGK41_04110, partial [Solirubrobacterales bacterium]